MPYDKSDTLLILIIYVRLALNSLYEITLEFWYEGSIYNICVMFTYISYNFYLHHEIRPTQSVTNKPMLNNYSYLKMKSLCYFYICLSLMLQVFRLVIAARLYFHVYLVLYIFNLFDLLHCCLVVFIIL